MMKKSIVIVTLLFFSMSCKKNNAKTPSIDGVWVESSQRKDTLSFDSSVSMVILGMGKEIRNGFLLPKSSSGPYSYRIDKDSISLQYSFSGMYKPKNYVFKFDSKNGKITIGNFYQNSLGSILTFSKAN